MVNACLPWSKAWVLLWTANYFVDLETPKHNAYHLINKNFEYLNSISNIFHKTQFLNVDGLSNYLYLFKQEPAFKKNHWRTFSWPREPPSSHLKINKVRFSLVIKYLLGLFLADFYCGKAFLVSSLKKELLQNCVFYLYFSHYLHKHYHTISISFSDISTNYLKASCHFVK